ncbi:MAG: cytochrome-c peroxidase [Chitinophagales bacterium]|nr:cytochrome-c peroxidase [Chitinophagales bacterium]
MNKKMAMMCCCMVFAVACRTMSHLFSPPSYFPPPHYDFKQNPLDKDKVLLGRILFYDPILSQDNTISCASCHSPYNSFAHTDHALSHGIGDKIGTRNAPALLNLAWHERFMWDGAIHHLDMQALAPITHPLEMAESMPNVVKKLEKEALYPPLFKKAFGDSTVTGENLLKALAQFQLTLVSNQAKFDSVMRKQSHFTEQEQHGYVLFDQHCSTCHPPPLFSTYQFANNGLPLDTVLKDYGKMKITQNHADSLLFKIPTLRNWEYTAPYMHDGRFQKIQQVLQHYTKNIQKSATLSKELQNGVVLSANEKIDLIAFLLTLNDRHFVFNPAVAFPKTYLLDKKNSSSSNGEVQ